MLRRDRDVETQTRRIGFFKPALSLLAAAGVATFVYHEGLKDRIRYKNLGQVEPGFYRSGQFSPFMVGPALSRIRPDLIVSLSHDNPDNASNMAERDAARAAGIERVHVNLKGDGTGDPHEYVVALGHILDARRDDRRVLVHCYAGSERTSGIVALYRTLIQKRDANAALAEEMSGHKHDFKKGVLVAYLNTHVDAIARGLVATGHLDAVPDPLPMFHDPSR